MAGILYYTDNQCQERILLACRKQLLKCCDSHHLVSVSQYPINFGKNIMLPVSRSLISMYKQIVAGLKTLQNDIVFLAEHDVVYHPSHFDFVPTEEKYYFNTNLWTVIAKTGECMHMEGAERASHMVAFRHILLDAYQEKLSQAIEYFKKTSRGFSRRYGYEPKNLPYEHYKSEHPNIDIKHGNNITAPRFNLNQYRGKTQSKIKDSFVITRAVPYWGTIGDNFDNFLRQL